MDAVKLLEHLKRVAPGLAMGDQADRIAAADWLVALGKHQAENPTYRAGGKASWSKL